MQDGLAEASRAALSGAYELVILDEINTAFFFDLLTRRAFEELLAALPESTELICTGRGAPEWLLDRADLITEMKEVRHYYTRGVGARRGIEN